MASHIKRILDCAARKPRSWEEILLGDLEVAGIPIFSVLRDHEVEEKGQ